MKNRQGIIWAPVLIMIGTVVVVGVAAYLLMQASNKSESDNTNVVAVNQANNNANVNLNTNVASNTNGVTNNNASTNTNTVSNTNTATDPTVGWKTYTNSTNKFAFQYPSEYVVERSTADYASFANSQSCLTQKQALPAGYDQQIIILGCHYFSVTVQGNKITAVGAGITKTTIPIGKLTGEKIKTVDGDSTSFVMQANRDSLWFVFNDALHSNNATAVETELNQILSTFLFTN